MNHTFTLAEAEVRRRARSSAAAPHPEGIGEHAVPAQGEVPTGPPTAPDHVGAACGTRVGGASPPHPRARRPVPTRACGRHPLPMSVDLCSSSRGAGRRPRRSAEPRFDVCVSCSPAGLQEPDRDESRGLGVLGTDSDGLARRVSPARLPISVSPWSSMHCCTPPRRCGCLRASRSPLLASRTHTEGLLGVAVHAAPCVVASTAPWPRPGPAAGLHLVPLPPHGPSARARMLRGHPTTVLTSARDAPPSTEGASRSGDRSAPCPEGPSSRRPRRPPPMRRERRRVRTVVAAARAGRSAPASSLRPCLHQTARGRLMVVGTPRVARLPPLRALHWECACSS